MALRARGSANNVLSHLQQWRLERMYSADPTKDVLAARFACGFQLEGTVEERVQGEGEEVGDEGGRNQ